MKRASIDIGSNTVLLVAAEVIESGGNIESFSELLNESRVTSLGKDLDKNKAFNVESMEATLEALSEYKELLVDKGFSLDQVIATATEASRVAENAEGFFLKIEKDLGFQIKIISPLDEAYLTAYGVVKGSRQSVRDITIMDIGGASTELISVQISPFEIKKTISLEVGSVRGTDWTNDGSFSERLDMILSNPEVSSFACEHLICVAGSMTSLAGMISGLKVFDQNKIQGSAISFQTYTKFFEGIKGMTGEDILKKYPFLGKRSKSIIAGAHLGLKVGKSLGVKTFEISTFGLRYGTLLYLEDYNYGKF